LEEIREILPNVSGRRENGEFVDHSKVTDARFTGKGDEIKRELWSEAIAPT
jgi:hypothetical protein